MSDELGLKKLLSDEGFFAGLLGRTPSGRDRRPLYGPDLPVVLLTGGPGMGKARLLRNVRDKFAAGVPVIHLDCRSTVHEERAEPEPAARSAMTEALTEVARRLNTWQGPGGEFVFPRLFTGLAVIATGAGGGSREAVATEIERYETLARRRRGRVVGSVVGMGRRGGGFWADAATGTVRAFVTGYPGHGLNDPVTQAVLGGLLDAFFERLAPRGHTELERIYGAYPGAAGQPKHGLLNLAADFQADGDGRELAEAFLFRALREDLEASYTSTVGWLTRVGRPGLLLDHAESPLGERLLRAVLTDRRSGRQDRMVIVGTARRSDGGTFLYGGLPPDEVPPPAEYRPANGSPPPWTRRRETERDGGPEQPPLADGVLLLRMPLLTGDQLRRETERTQTGAAHEGGANRRRIDAAVTRLSGGRPHTVRRLAKAASAFRMEPHANDRVLLDAPWAGSSTAGEHAPTRPVGDVLLQELVLDQLPVTLPEEHHDRWLDLLTHLSVAHDEECADVLLRHHQAGRVHRLTAHHVSTLLTDAGWPHCERHFIGDFGLRQLLLHRLYGLSPDGEAWYADHHLLRDHYAAVQEEHDAERGQDQAAEQNPEQDQAPDAAGRDAQLPFPPAAFRSATAHRMNHQLVSGGADDVVRHLADTLPGRPREWCAELLDIAQAPFPGDVDQRHERAQGLTTADAAPPLHRTVDQLLHAVWLCEERTRPTGRQTANTLARLLELLSIMEFPGAGRLGHTATEWSGLAANEQPLRRCSCTEPLARRR